MFPHDLQTLPPYLDHVVLLNMRVVAAGPSFRLLGCDATQLASSKPVVDPVIKEIAEQHEVLLRDRLFTDFAVVDDRQTAAQPLVEPLELDALALQVVDAVAGDAVPLARASRNSRPP